MNELEIARERINGIDAKMAALFEERMQVAELVADYKKKNGLPVLDATREKQLTEKNSLMIENEAYKGYYARFIKNMMAISRDYQSALMGDCENGGSIPVCIDGESYDIILSRGAISRLGSYFKLDRKALIVTDSGVPREYAETVASQCKEAYVYTVLQGEGSKNTDNYIGILSELLAKGFTRTDCVIAVGGGVCTDLAGFVASSYMRGIDFYSVPTTLLAQVDASVGGKVAIDLNGVKNTVGTFYQPKCVLMDPDTLNTLDERQIRSGLSEIIKMAVTLDRELFELLERTEDIYSDIDRIIERSVKIKKAVVEADAKESGLRRVLNFGHTIGHAIESFYDGALLHGECVAMGMVPMAGERVRDALISVLEKYHLDTKCDCGSDRLMPYVLGDKKMSGDEITVVLCNEIGSFEMRRIKAEEIKNYIDGGMLE